MHMKYWIGENMFFTRKKRDPFFGKGEKISSVELKKSYNKLTGK